jgi:hypothetical protein
MILFDVTAKEIVLYPREEEELCSRGKVEGQVFLYQIS